MNVIEKEIKLLDREWFTSSRTWDEVSCEMLSGLDGLYLLTLTGKAIAKLGKGYIHILDIGAVTMPNSWIFFGGKDLFHTWTMTFEPNASYMIHVRGKTEEIESLGPNAQLCILNLNLKIQKIEPAAEGSNVVYRRVEPELEPPMRNIIL
jgi:hypothetical protein